MSDLFSPITPLLATSRMFLRMLVCYEQIAIGTGNQIFLRNFPDQQFYNDGMRTCVVPPMKKTTLEQQKIQEFSRAIKGCIRDGKTDFLALKKMWRM